MRWQGCVLVLVVLALGSSIAAAGETGNPSVRIQSPVAGQAVFQRITVEVAIGNLGSEDGEVERLDVWLDGRLAGSLRALPYRLEVDFGEDNVAHVLEAVAWGAAGEIGRHRLELPALVADDVVDIELQQIYVTVTDARGQRALGLSAQDFELRDEGKPQELVTFSGGEIPFTAVLLVDGSSSMAGEPMLAAASGVRRFADQLAAHDEAKVLVISDQILRRGPWSGQAEALAGVIDGVLPQGGSALIDHLYLGLGLAEARQGRRVVILLSDGLDLHSALDLRQVRRIARQSQAMIFWVRLGEGPPKRSLRVDSASLAASTEQSGVYFRAPRRIPLSSWRDSQEAVDLAQPLESLVEMTGGRVLRVERVEDIGDALTDIVSELRQQYALGYDPRPRRNDGSWRRVKIRLEGHRGWKIRSREGYVDR